MFNCFFSIENTKHIKVDKSFKYKYNIGDINN